METSTKKTDCWQWHIFLRVSENEKKLGGRFEAWDSDGTCHAWTIGETFRGAIMEQVPLSFVAETYESTLWEAHVDHADLVVDGSTLHFLDQVCSHRIR